MTKRTRRTTGNKSLSDLSNKMKKQIHMESRIANVESVAKEWQDFKKREADFLSDMMFSVNAISRILIKTGLQYLTVKNEWEDDTPLTVGMLKESINTMPVIKMEDLMKEKSLCISEYKESRNRQLPLTHKNITMSIQEWADKLAMTYEELREYLDTGVALEDVVDTLDKSELLDKILHESDTESSATEQPSEGS